MVNNVEDKIEQALALKARGYNCAQCVAAVFAPHLVRHAAGLGGGVAGTGHICGACSAMALIASERDYESPADKQALYGRIKEMMAEFERLNGGDSDCRDLRKPGRKSCNALIADAIRILSAAYD